MREGEWREGDMRVCGYAHVRVRHEGVRACGVRCAGCAGVRVCGWVCGCAGGCAGVRVGVRECAES
jgi:hypothetical protein